MTTLVVDSNRAVQPFAITRPVTEHRTPVSGRELGMTTDDGNPVVAIGVPKGASPILAAYAAVAEQIAADIDRLAALIRQVQAGRSLDARALAEGLVVRGVTVSTVH